MPNDNPKRAACKEEPLQLFDSLHFHPSVIKVSRHRFATGEYADAIFASFELVETTVKRISDIDKAGRDLMAEAFNEKGPRIAFNSMSSRSDKDEQEGLKLVFMGVAQGIRNPKAHEEILQNDVGKTLEYIGLASLLLKRIDEGLALSKPTGAWESVLRLEL